MKKQIEEAIVIIETLLAYGRIRSVSGVRYPAGSHLDMLDKADKWLWDNRPQNKVRKKKGGYEPSNEIDYQMLDNEEVIGKKIVDIYLHKDPVEGDELQLLLEDGKQIEISLLLKGTILVQSD